EREAPWTARRSASPNARLLFISRVSQAFSSTCTTAEYLRQQPNDKDEDQDADEEMAPGKTTRHIVGLAVSVHGLIRRVVKERGMKRHPVIPSRVPPIVARPAPAVSGIVSAVVIGPGWQAVVCARGRRRHA